MLALRLPKDLERRLDKLAKKTGRTKSYYAKEAIARFLEDREDFLRGMSVLERLDRGEESLVTLQELQKRFGLDG